MEWFEKYVLKWIHPIMYRRFDCTVKCNGDERLRRRAAELIRYTLIDTATVVISVIQAFCKSKVQAFMVNVLLRLILCD